MAKVLVNKEDIESIASAIKEMLGITSTFKLADMPELIRSISGDNVITNAQIMNKLTSVDQDLYLIYNSVKNVTEPKVIAINSNVSTIKTDVSTIKTDVASIKTSVNNIGALSETETQSIVSEVFECE